MKALIIGYGSMGRRRIRLLRQLSDAVSFICVDNNPKRLEQIALDGFQGMRSIDCAIAERPDVAFVCTSPGHHADIILKLIESGIHVFTELNLTSDRYDEIIEEAKHKNVRVFMSSTMLYDRQILSIFNKIGDCSENLTYLFHVGQYLPDWHPWENYRDFFIGKKETNGIREILAIQLPWIVKLFGRITDLRTIKRKNTKLEIDFDDTYIITFEHERGNTGVFVCDILSRKAVNYLEIMGEETHIIWNGTPESLHAFDQATKSMILLSSYEGTKHEEEYSDIIIEDQYVDEIKAFLDMIVASKEPRYTLEDDKYILGIIDEIEGDK